LNILRRSLTLAALSASLLGCAGPGPSAPAGAAPAGAELVRQLAPTGSLRIGVYPGSPTSMVKTAAGETRGVTVEVGRALAARLGVPAQLVEFPRVAEVVEALKAGRIDFTITNASPARAAEVDFAPPLIEIELGYLVVPGSPVATLADVDQPGRRIGVSQGSSSQAALSREFKQASILTAPTLQAAREMLGRREIDAFATNKAILSEMADALPGARILAGRWGLEHVAIALPKGRPEGLAFVRRFADEAKADGLVAGAAQRAGLRGLRAPGT
jgi:polar amino acid transport system substrate-binding protein